MKKVIKIVALMVLCCFIISIFPNTCFAVEETGEEKYSDLIVSTENGYEVYFSSIDTKNNAEKYAIYNVNSLCDTDPVEITVIVENEGVYNLGIEYMLKEERTSPLEISMLIDGEIPFSECEALYLPLSWNIPDETRKDGLGNEFSPEAEISSGAFSSFLADSSGWSDEEYLFYFSKGEHKITVLPVDGSFELKSLSLSAPKVVKNYNEMDINSSSNTSKNDIIVIEGEKADLVSDYWLIPRSDSTSASIYPVCRTVDRINYIGGSTWKNPGEKISWNINVKKTGYYQLGFSYKQSDVINASTYRTLRIDGEIPFKEAEEIPFGYSTNWETSTFSDAEEKPYLVYLTEGDHIISLTVTSGPIYDVSMLLKETVAELGDIYMDITMITGETVDNYRDYDLFDSIENLDGRLEKCSKNLNSASKALSEIGNQGTGSYDSSIKSMVQVLEKMLENRYTAHRYLNDYYSKYCSVASVLNEMRSMPLCIDRIYFTPSETEPEYNTAGFFKQFLFSTVKFLQSFTADYNNISDINDENETISIWVNWGRDQAQVLNSLIQSSFTPKYKTNVEIKVVNATMVQAVLSGNAPDCFLQHSRSEPVNLAIRGVLLDLKQFDDLDEVLGRFQEGADIPYRYYGGLYALPDTQNFYLLFYRKDIFETFGFSVPKTWDEFITVSKVFSRNNLQSWLHYTQITATNQIDAGIGSLNLFPSMLLQRGLSLYSQDHKSTMLSSSEVIKTFEYWTDFYTKLKTPITLSFYNRFRTGTCPMGIEPYTTYTTLKAAAPEIDGLWGVAPIPGIKNEDGTISNISTGGGTGCAILKSTDSPKQAWEFLKWWTSAETQYSYTQNVEAVLGPTGRVAVSNVEAFNKMSWDSKMKSEILSAWEQVEEVPEVPGSYYVSRSIDLSFWSVVNENLNPKDVLLERSAEVDDEIERKWNQYENRGN